MRKSLLASAFIKGAEALAIVWEALSIEELDKFMSKYDQVYAVWHDPAAPNEYFFLSIKGQSEWAKGEGVRANSVPCTNREAALLLQARYGDAVDIASNDPIWETPAPISH
jgi:hypothetical protein